MGKKFHCQKGIINTLDYLGLLEIDDPKKYVEELKTSNQKEIADAWQQGYNKGWFDAAHEEKRVPINPYKQ